MRRTRPAPAVFDPANKVILMAYQAHGVAWLLEFAEREFAANEAKRKEIAKLKRQLTIERKAARLLAEIANNEVTQ